ncbi:FMN-linked oxidoreductase [Phellopilus nigrolimitatus]|nr:FMN-linked oxidoreductase [Phellopilus nigrolimitatus]
MTLSSTSASHPLFSPLKVGNVTLQHRVAMAPLTRFRADDAHVPTDLMVEHYAQRASVPGTLLISEGTFIAQKAGGYENVPGIWNDAQVRAWKKVVDAVHARGSFIFLQLWALGRASKPALLAQEAQEAGLPADAFPYISASDVQQADRAAYGKPRPLTEPEIDEYVELYAQAARNAVDGAGFDGVEIHDANGYLLDQFQQDITNTRTDAYGGSVAARAKFPLRVAAAVARAVGPARTGVRISPWNDFQGMRMADPVPQFAHFAAELRRAHPGLAFLHVVEGHRPGDSVDFLRDVWRAGAQEGSVFLSCLGHDRASALRHAEKGDVVVFGKLFISNPDLPRRLKEDIPLNPFNPATFYLAKSPVGYIDQPFAPAAPETVAVSKAGL